VAWGAVVIRRSKETCARYAEGPRLTVLQAKFSAYLSWSQPFLHALLSNLEPKVRNVILCNRTENLDRFPVRHVERLPNRYLAKPRLAVLAASYLRRTWAPDLIHAHFGWSGIRLVLLKQILRIPLVVTFGGRDVGLQMQLPGFDRLYRLLLEASDALICVSADLRDKLLDAGADGARIHVIHRGVDLRAFGFVDRSARPAGGPLRTLMVGRIVEKKGHRYALEALASLAEQGCDAQLTVVGEGEAYHELRGLQRRLRLGRRVEFVGSTDHAGVRSHMAAADVLVHCSHTPAGGDVEGIPNAVVEAQATGLPVVATRHGGIAEAVRDGVTGLLVPERSVAPLRDALRRLAEERAFRLTLGRQARAFVTEHLSLDAQVAAHRRIYAELVARAAADPTVATPGQLPEDYGELMRCTILAQDLRHPHEFSIAELLEQLVWMRRFERRFAVGQPGGTPPQDGLFLPEATRLRPGSAAAAPGSSAGASRLERLYGLKGRVPQSIKFPVKKTLGRLLVWAIDQRHRRLEGDALEALEAEDDRVLRFFREGGRLEDWNSGLRGPAGAEGAARPGTAGRAGEG
jgi:colanic acid/amylovoran biosynthesis glycosyltransferase